FYDCEEVAADRNGLLRLSGNSPELLAGDFAVLMEPSSAEIEGGCQGTLRAEIVVSGQRAHTARSWMGRNAIHEAGAVLDVLRGYTPREPEVDGLRYHEGLNALGIPAVNYGPGISEIAHTPGEYVEISKIAECEARLRAWLDGS